MVNVVSLHSRQVFLSAGSPAAYGKAYFYRSGTNTQVSVYSDVDTLTPRSQPVPLSSAGVLPPCYVTTTDPLRILITDEVDVALPGYPMDNIVPELATQQDASGVAFSPTEGIAETNVQAAIEAVALLFTDQSSLLSRFFTAYTTGGSGNAYTITPSPAITAYATGQSFLIRPDRENTGAATINVNGLGLRDIRVVNASGTPAALTGGEIQPYREFTATYDGSRFLITDQRNIVSWGANSNGSWVRVGRLQFCWAGATYSGNLSGASNASGTWTYPVAFAAQPQCWCQARRGSVPDAGTVESVAAADIGGAIAASSSTQAIYGVRNNNAGAREVRLDTFAIGWSF